ncbi:MAG: hypothetical protein ACO3A2_08795 [Bdellovibrionia bacterium]
MKIQPLTTAFGYPRGVRDRKEDSPSSDRSFSQEHGKKDRKPPFEESPSDESFSPQQLEQALEDFQSDSQAQAHGLSVHLETHSLGLRVILKDSNGKTLRQFSGEEFIKLRGGKSSELKFCGKILDQKL